MSDEREKSYQSGIEAGIAMWGRVCGSQGNCSTCPIGALRGANVTCQDFAKNFPAKMVSILTEMDEKQISYYQEYCMRFPECNIPINELAQMVCRKVVFEGYVFCDKCSGDNQNVSECIACWNEKYNGDITVKLQSEFNGENYNPSSEDGNSGLIFGGTSSDGDEGEKPAFL